MDNVVTFADYSTNECGDIVIVTFQKELVSIKKEGQSTIVLSLPSFMRMLNKWIEIKEEIKIEE